MQNQGSSLSHVTPLGESASGSPERRPKVVVPATATLLSLLMAALLWGIWALVTRSPGDGPNPGAPPVTEGPQTGMNERRIRISADAISVVALLNDSPTADRLWQELPVTGRVQLWGDEIYFSIPSPDLPATAVLSKRERRATRRRRWTRALSRSGRRPTRCVCSGDPHL